MRRRRSSRGGRRCVSSARKLPRIKVCGIRALADIAAALELGVAVDAVGLVAHPASPRHLDAKKAAALVGELPFSILPVAVFVDRDRASIARFLKETGAG